VANIRRGATEARRAEQAKEEHHDRHLASIDIYSLWVVSTQPKAIQKVSRFVKFCKVLWPEEGATSAWRGSHAKPQSSQRNGKEKDRKMVDRNMLYKPNPPARHFSVSHVSVNSFASFAPRREPLIRFAGPDLPELANPPGPNYN
jgi:hypothetical protein